MAGLSADQIQALLGRTRTKGQYRTILGEFLASEQAGINVQEEYVELRDKQPSTIKQGFEGAKNHAERPAGAENVRVLTQTEGEGDNKVTTIYLVNMAHPELAGAEA
jgi:hypothetical protein